MKYVSGKCEGNYVNASTLLWGKSSSQTNKDIECTGEGEIATMYLMHDVLDTQGRRHGIPRSVVAEEGSCYVVYTATERRMMKCRHGTLPKQLHEDFKKVRTC